MGESFPQWLDFLRIFRNNAIILFSPTAPVMCHSGGGMTAVRANWPVINSGGLHVVFGGRNSLLAHA
jgi:hypothetical protein